MTAALRPAPAGTSQPGPKQPAPATAAGRRWRLPLAIAAVVLLGAIVIALVAPAAQTPGYLDPASTQPWGARALADILAARGAQVTRAASPAAAVSAARGRGAAIVVPSPGDLTGAGLRDLAASTARLVIVEPSQAALRVLAPGVSARFFAPVSAVEPGCRLPAAALAGNALLGGAQLTLAPGAPGVACYRHGRQAFLIQYSRRITILGTGVPLQNQDLARLGDAALALNLLRGSRQIAWLVPQPAAVAAAGSGSFWGLVPLGAYLVAAELGVAVLLAALWRARRLGPLVTEPLPVVVRAAETTEGHARLYQASRSRGQAADALRAAVATRLARALGLPADVGHDILTADIARRTGRAPEQVQQLLYGPAPATDAGLVRLADELDTAEREVRAQ